MASRFERGRLSEGMMSFGDMNKQGDQIDVEAVNREYSYVMLTTKAIPEIAKTPPVLDAFLSSPYTDMHTKPTATSLENGLGTKRDLYDRIKIQS